MDSSLNSDTSNSNADSGAHEICAPLEALQVSGTSPEVGDEVDVTVKGTISRVEGNMAYLTPETFNDVPAPQGTGTDGSESDNLRGMLNNDQNNNY